MPTARTEPRRRHGRKHSRSPSPVASVFRRLKQNRSSSLRLRPRKEGGVFNRLGRKEPDAYTRSPPEFPSKGNRAWNATARSLQYDASEHVSDGVSNGGDSIKPPFFLRLKGSHDSEEPQCEQIIWTDGVSNRKAQDYVVTGAGLLAGSGVVTDAETSYHAKVMFFSLIPFVVILLPSVFGWSYSSQGNKIAYLVSLLCFGLFCYYLTSLQRFDPRIQKRRVEYAEVERKLNCMYRFMKYKHLYKIKKRSNQVAKLLLEDKNKLIELISLMMERASGQKLLLEGGALDESAIDRFFERIDNNHDGFITRFELKNFIMEVNYEEILMDDEIAEIIMRHLDIDGNGDIDKQEFKSGVTKWIKEIEHVATRNQQKQSQENNRVSDRYQKAEAKAKEQEKFKAIILLLVGIFMLTVLAEPLVESVREFSESVRIEPFYVSFILVPLATNARTAIAAIRAASQKRHQTTSLTFSEIYHKVFMNNILGFSVLVSVIYFRGLTWHFSAEILVVVIVCIIMGLLASIRSKFPSWTLFIAFPLYPLSLVVVYFVDDTFRSEISRGCNASFVTIIPKVADPIGLGDFRPIILIGCYYKIISKILAERIKKVVGTVVRDAQNKFIKDRYILDGILIANESIEYMKKSKEKGLIFKSATMSILVNGSPTKEFCLERGVRQGDPLSSFLFILAAECLNAIVKEAVYKRIFRGVRVGVNRVMVSHLQYADDTIFFGQWSKENARSLMCILKCFEEVSELRVNYNKSKLYGWGLIMWRLAKWRDG
ncbi:sodium/calcium exchanger NCL2-like protein [Tanacetum coccineum]